MIKREELSNPNSCINQADDDEPTFVLLGRDASAPDTIRFWADRRVRVGKNTPTDTQIAQALDIAIHMEQYWRQRVKPGAPIEYKEALTKAAGYWPKWATANNYDPTEGWLVSPEKAREFAAFLLAVSTKP